MMYMNVNISILKAWQYYDSDFLPVKGEGSVTGILESGCIMLWRGWER